MKFNPVGNVKYTMPTPKEQDPSWGARNKWKEEHKDCPRVLAWIEKNPPPKEWLDIGLTDLDWAYTEMPSWAGMSLKFLK